MANRFLFLSLFILLFGCNAADRRPVVGDSEYQRKQNAIFKDASRSPLKKKDLKNFKKLEFFPIDSSFIVDAQLELTPDAPVFKMATTTERKPLYRQYGILTFELLGQSQTLHLYRSQEEKESEEFKDYLFLPFTDLTSGDTSYGGGRYMNLFISDIKDGVLTLNFNNTYNPYCAYNEKYSCPLTPRKNRLTVAVTAGIKAYNKVQIEAN